MRANLDQYTKEDIAEAFRAYMEYVGAQEGTNFVSRYELARYPNETHDSMSKTSADIIHAIDEALGE